MRHLRAGRKLNRTASHRKAMLGNMAVSVLDKERITTTLAKAKEVRGLIERLITYGKRDSLHAIRLAGRTVKDKRVLNKLFKDIGPSYKERNGGYLRIVKTGERKGDNALMAILELVGRAPRADRPKKAAKPKAGDGQAPQAGEQAGEAAQGGK
jgi:large subunit ribosomal protein L17